MKKHECSIHVLNANIKVMESLGVILCASDIKEASNNVSRLVPNRRK